VSTSYNSDRYQREQAVNNAITSLKAANKATREAKEKEIAEEYRNAENEAWNEYLLASQTAYIMYATAYQDAKNDYRSASAEADDEYLSTILPAYAGYQNTINNLDLLFESAVAQAGDSNFNPANFFNNGTNGNQGNVLLISNKKTNENNANKDDYKGDSIPWAAFKGIAYGLSKAGQGLWAPIRSAGITKIIGVEGFLQAHDGHLQWLHDDIWGSNAGNWLDQGTNIGAGTYANASIAILATGGAEYLGKFESVKNMLGKPIISGTLGVGGAGLGSYTAYYSGKNAIISFQNGQYDQAVLNSEITVISLYGIKASINVIQDAIASVAAIRNNALINNANFAQKYYTSNFSNEGTMHGRSIQEVVESLKNGSLKVNDLPIQYAIIDDHVLILNTRSAQALQQAGISRNQWIIENVSNDPEAMTRLFNQLTRNKLSNEGFPNPIQK
jgi:hypothetical protein